ncbi:hypothetical protein [Amaricoccus solimangrovi]|uniref:Uncharacterized protein n=1 Tax=Amaricoccus solimangrovi TaxID=2589815 RepID=A0A501WSS3_9RHOB|nr:hypothetical protein [Amaricoccus solimangrovi]TPE48846.1 hypothetical protein FJM51_16690 [Amaricoccus solimangrovi]
MHRQIGILVSAMILGAQLGSPAKAEQPSADELREIASLLSSDDYSGLRTYLRAHPELLIEDTTLAGLLRQFLAGSNSAASGLDSDLNDALRRFSSQDSSTTDSAPGGGGGASLY